jgi:hypothetical protein
LNEEVAFPMPDVDHRQMCKYEHKFVPGYNLVINRLQRIQAALQKEDLASHDEVFAEVRANLL